MPASGEEDRFSPQGQFRFSPQGHWVQQSEGSSSHYSGLKCHDLVVNPWKFTCSDTPNYHMCWWCSDHFTIKLWFNMMFNRWKPYVWFPSAVPFINCACNVGTQGITAEPIPWDFKHQFFSTHWKLPSSRVKIQISPESYPCCSSWRAESKEYPIMLSCLAKSGLGYWYRMLDFTFPLQLKGTCLPQKNCFSLDLVYYMVGIA